MYGFDTERPYGAVALTEEGRIERERNLAFISNMNDVFDAAGIGRTFFILGDYFDKSAQVVGEDHLREVFRPQNPLIEIGQHTYTHPILAGIPTRPDKVPVTLETAREEIKKATRSLKSVFGLDQISGLRTPLGYAHRTLETNTALLDVLKDEGLVYISSSLRDQEFGINAPLVESGELRQPFRYINGLVEVPSHGWQDTAFTGTSKTTSATGYPTDKESIVRHYVELMDEAHRLSDQKREHIFVGLCLHPWAVRRYDPKLEIMKSLFDHADKKGFKSDAYRSALKAS